MKELVDEFNRLADDIGKAAGNCRLMTGLPPSYNIADQVDQMVILYGILGELRKITRMLKDADNG
ncbi:MAG TPA: hypothetical protein ENH84_01285 [Phycisphaerae bacterium]|nr:hypothetical protein [Phycisphaerae bacterium]